MVLKLLDMKYKNIILSSREREKVHDFESIICPIDGDAPVRMSPSIFHEISRTEEINGRN
jgi:hypothetical protein